MPILDWNSKASRGAILDAARQEAESFFDRLPDRPVHAAASVQELRRQLAVPLPTRPQEPEPVFRELVAAMDRGLVAEPGPRYFGFVIGGTLPIALAADWMTSAWDQNSGLYSTSPAASVAEEVAAAWLLDLLGLPSGASVGFVTGCQMANFTALAAARHAVLRRAGWNVEEEGLAGAPRVNIVLSAEAHATIHTSLRYLGFGLRSAKLVEADDQGRMILSKLEEVLATCEGPTIVCAQVGNVNTGSIDPLAGIIDAAHARGAWVHLDSAFGLWAAASPSRRRLVDGVERADSWATDGHKWLNVPYDCGIVVVAHPEDHRASMSVQASYLIQTAGAERDPVDWVPEFSRRGRGIPVYAALRALGREGVASLVDRGCDLATIMARTLSAEPGVAILNEVVLNQVLVRFADSDDVTREVVRRVQEDGTCWLSGTTWHGKAAMRISVSNWSTTEEDIGRSAAAIVKAFRSAGAVGR